MIGTAVAAAVSAAAVLAVSPYLARLVATVPDAADAAWWRGAPAASGQRRRVVLTAAVLGLLAGVAAGWTARLPALIALVVLATPLIVIDIAVHRLPDRLMFALGGAAVALLALAAAVEDRWPHYLRAIESAAVVFAVLLVLALISPRSFGFGDVKLGAVLGGYLGWVGWPLVYYGLAAGFVLGALVAVVLMAAGRAGRKTAIPFGPMLVVGALVVLAANSTFGS